MKKSQLLAYVEGKRDERKDYIRSKERELVLVEKSEMIDPDELDYLVAKYERALLDANIVRDYITEQLGYASYESNFNNYTLMGRSNAVKAIEEAMTYNYKASDDVIALRKEIEAVVDEYAKVLDGMKALSSAKKCLEYLVELGFDRDEMEALDQSSTEVAIVQADKKLLFGK
jgi:hypothetical protein